MIGALLVAAALAAEPAWTMKGTHDGITLESRQPEGSRFYEFRASTDVVGTPDALCDQVFDFASLKPNSPEVKVRKVLEDRGDVRIVHDQLNAPLVANRTITFAIKKSHAGDGTCTVESHAQNDMAPPTPEGWVRIEKMNTSWHFEPRDGKTRVTFVLFVDPAGSVPAFLVHGAQRAATLNTLRTAVTTRP